MAKGILVLGESGLGKSTSIGNIPEIGIQGLPPKETVIINPRGKILPFRSKGYTKFDKDHLTGNHLTTLDAGEIINALRYVNENRPEIKYVVFDDAQYIMASYFMENALVKGEKVYTMFRTLAKDMYDLLNIGLGMRDDIVFITMSHSEETRDGFKMKTIGKMFDQYCTPEGMFSIVLYTLVKTEGKKVEHFFLTNNDGVHPAKSPSGMFPGLHIPNDMSVVIKYLNEYV